MLIADEGVEKLITIRLSKADNEALREVAAMIGGRGTVSKLTRYAIKKHILMAREEFEKNPDFWK